MFRPQKLCTCPERSLLFPSDLPPTPATPAICRDTPLCRLGRNMTAPPAVCVTRPLVRHVPTEAAHDMKSLRVMSNAGVCSKQPRLRSDSFHYPFAFRAESLFCVCADRTCFLVRPVRLRELLSPPIWQAYHRHSVPQ